MKNKKKPGWIPKWRQTWNREILHKVKGRMEPKERPDPTWDPGQTNHERVKQQRARR